MKCNRVKTLYQNNKMMILLSEPIQQIRIKKQIMKMLNIERRKNNFLFIL